MSDHIVKNVPASIRQRLLNKARADNRPFNELLQLLRDGAFPLSLVDVSALREDSFSKAP